MAIQSSNECRVSVNHGTRVRECVFVFESFVVNLLLLLLYVFGIESKINKHRKTGFKIGHRMACVRNV